MGRIKTSFIKRIGADIYQKHASEFTVDYPKNKQIARQFLDVQSKKLFNIIVGYITRLKKQEKG